MPPKLPLPRGWNTVSTSALSVTIGPQVGRSTRFLASSGEANRVHGQGVQYR